MRRLLLLSLLCIAGGSLSGDPLAAGPEVLPYRTGSIHPRSASVPGTLLTAVFTDPVRHLPALVRQLTAGSHTPYDTVRRIHDWITLHIAYDNDLFYGLSRNGSRQAYAALKLRRTTCGGFSAIFSEMGRLAGLEVVRITAYARTYGRVDTGKIADHAWNGVRIAGKWYVVDCTADGRISYMHGKFGERRGYRSDQLFIHPAAKILENFPYKQEHQFLDPPLSFAEWRHAPRVNRWAWAFGIRLPAALRHRLREGKEPREGGRLYGLHDRLDLPSGRGSIRFRTRQDLKIEPWATLLDPAGKPCRSNVLMYRDGDEQVCDISAPAPGVYTLRLSGQVFGGDTRFHTFYSCRIRAGKAGGPLPALPGKLFARSRLEYYGVRINQLQTDSNGCVADISWPAGSSVWVDLRDARGNKAWEERAISYQDGNRQVWYFSTRDAAPRYLRIYARRTEKFHQEVAVVRIDAHVSHLLPEDRPVFSRLWTKSGCLLSGMTVMRGRYLQLRITAPQSRVLLAIIQDSQGKRYPEATTVTRIGGEYRLTFAPPGSGAYTLRVAADNDQGRYNTVLSFGMRAREAGIRNLPKRYPELYSRFHKEGFVLLAAAQEAGGFRLRIRAPADVTIGAVLVDDRNRWIGGRSVVRHDGTDWDLFFPVRKENGTVRALFFRKTGDGKRQYLGKITLSAGEQQPGK